MKSIKGGKNAGLLLSNSLVESERINFMRQFPQRIHPRFSAGGRILNQVVKAGLSNYDDEMRYTARQVDPHDYGIPPQQI